MNMPGKKLSVRASLLLGLFAGLPAAADDTRTDETSASCREETRRVVVWPTGGNPKSAQSGRSEDRAVMVCDGKVMSQALRRN